MKCRVSSYLYVEIKILYRQRRILNRPFPFPYEQAMGQETTTTSNKQLWNGTIAFPCEQKQKPTGNRFVPV